MNDGGHPLPVTPISPLAKAAFEAGQEHAKTRQYGRKNVYLCDACHGAIACIDIDDGATPAFLACRVKGEPTPDGCQGTMQSQWYPAQLPDPGTKHMGRLATGSGTELHMEVVEFVMPEIEWEWYRPTSDLELTTMSREVLDHVQRGGLLLRHK